MSKTFHVHWCFSGVEIVEADNAEQAEEMVEDMCDDLFETIHPYTDMSITDVVDSDDID